MIMASKKRYFGVYCLIALMLSGLMGQVMAAKKYYPNGFSPSMPEMAEPASSPKETPPPVSSRTIIKVVTASPKPTDPLQSLLAEQRYTEALRLLDKRLRKSP